MGGFASWSAMATDSFLHGAEFGVALGGIALLIAFGVSQLAQLFKQLI